jgi:hypothetical protein
LLSLTTAFQSGTPRPTSPWVGQHTRIDGYFQGEEIEALVFILPTGLVSLIFAAWLFAEGTNGFTRGVAIPFLLMGLLMTTVCCVVGFRTPSQVAQLQQGVETEPQSATAAESLRMEKVNRAWGRYLILWGLMGALGLGLRFAVSGDFAHGLGIALVLFSGLGLMVDGFAERRARAYTAVLEGVAAPTPGTAPPVSR